jgi:hypothetical protein
MSRKLRHKLVLLAGLMLSPFWFLRIRLTRVDPMDYFLVKLGAGSGTYQPILLLAVLGRAARRFDASAALRALRCLSSPFPLWALATRHMQLLLEAPLWLGEKEEFHRAWAELQRSDEAGADIRGLLLDYMEFSRDEHAATDVLKDQLVLPALHWERLARRAEFACDVRKTREALHRALHFVPELDPRRPELVARLMQAEAEAVATTRGDPDDRPPESLRGH